MGEILESVVESQSIVEDSSQNDDVDDKNLTDIIEEGKVIGDKNLESQNSMENEKVHDFAVPDLPLISSSNRTLKSNVIANDKELAQSSNNNDFLCKQNSKNNEEDICNDEDNDLGTSKAKIKENKLKTKQKNVEFPHQEPPWGGVPSEHFKYSLTVLKEGIVKGTVDLAGKSRVTFGRLPEACDVVMEHPSCSRFHALIQYCIEEKEIRKVGYYVYDLGSTHGTYVNKERVKPKVYVRVRVGYQIKFGGSSRLYIIEGPDDDQEEEIDMTEVKKIREHNKQIRANKEQQNKANKVPEDSNEGASWGFQEDAEEEELDLQALMENKKKIEVKDPKKTLKGFFEREGIELEYEMSERGTGRSNNVVHIAQVRLPMESSYGVEMIAEGTSSNKKDAVLLCATDACRIIQAYDMMQNKCSEDQRVKRQRELEANDYYDSDDDNYLDRTGSVEKKRLKRKQLAGKGEKLEAETHDSLKKKLNEKTKVLQSLETKLTKSIKASNDDNDGDSLDAFMSNMDSKLDKKSESQMKRQIKELSGELVELKKLVEITQPAALPALRLEKLNYKIDYKVISGKLEKPHNESEKNKKKPEKQREKSTHEDQSATEPTQKVELEIVKENKSAPPSKKKKVYGVMMPPPQVKNTKDTHEKEFVEWLPPENQSGDGRTHLNDKLGY